MRLSHDRQPDHLPPLTAGRAIRDLAVCPDADASYIWRMFVSHDRAREASSSTEASTQARLRPLHARMRTSATAILVSTAAAIAHPTFAGGDVCDPLDVVSATGSLYSFAQASSAQYSTEIPLNLAALLASGQSSSVSAGLPNTSNYATATNFIALQSGESLEVVCDALGHANATGSFAFARSDIDATAVLHLPTTRRVRVVLQLHGSGISDLSFMLRRMDPWIIAFDAGVSTYIKPQTVTNEARLVLGADDYQLRVYGSLQSNTGFRNPDDGAYGGHLSVTCARIADIDFDGEVNAADLAVLLGAWGGVPPFHAADLNQDGFVNGADLAALLADW